jgi:hypothetical protein
MKRILIVILIFTLNNTFAQIKSLNEKSDTVYWFNFHGQLIKEIGLENINETKYDTIIRFWDDYKVIQICNTNGKIDATVYFFLREYVKSEANNGRLFKSSMQLDTLTTNILLQLIADFEILKLPSDKFITNWVQGFDGITYITEFSNSVEYSFKSYWTPTAQIGVKEARFFQYFINELENIDVINSAFKKFLKYQPFESYYSGYGSSSITITKIKTTR